MTIYSPNRYIPLHTLGGVTNKNKNFAPVQAGDLRKPLKTPSGGKSFKCNQCDSACGQAGNLRTHLKTTLEKSVQMHPMRLCICGHISKLNMKKNPSCRQSQKVYKSFDNEFSVPSELVLAQKRFEHFLFMICVMLCLQN